MRPPRTVAARCAFAASYETLQEETYDLFGSLPGTIDDAWIEDDAQLGLRLDQHVRDRGAARNAFDDRYDADIDCDTNRWEQCARVFAREDVVARTSRSW